MSSSYVDAISFGSLAETIMSSSVLFLREVAGLNPLSYAVDVQGVVYYDITECVVAVRNAEETK